MKKIFVFTSMCILTLSGIKAQEDQQSPSIDANTFRLQFFNLAQSEFVPTFEHKFKKTSISISPILKYKNKQANVYSSYKDYRNEIIGFGGALEFRRYMVDIDLEKSSGEEIRKGLYMSFSGAYNYYYATAYVEETQPYTYDEYGNVVSGGYTIITEKKDEYINFQGVALFGVQDIIYDALVIDLYVGAGIKISQGYDGNYYFDAIESSNTVFSSKYSGIIPKIGFSLGFAF